MCQIPLINFILYILCEELHLHLATAQVSANNAIFHKVASSSLAYDSIQPAIFHTTTNTVTKTITATTSSNFAVIRNDLLCNNGSEFVCVCQQNAGNLLKHYILCNELIEFKELPVIVMNIRRVNLSARLQGNETYESYFKRRIATLISNYCEQQADECMATTLRLKKENVVLLSIEPDNLQSTTVNFVITKSQRRSPLNTMTILDSNKVKYVLSAQLADLSRVLGGVRIEQIEMSIMEKYRNNNGNKIAQQDSFGLLPILFAVATFLTITYTIAAIRVCRDCYAKRQAKKNAEILSNTFKTSNYGTYIQPTQNEIYRDHGIPTTVNMKTSEGNDSINSNPNEIVVLDACQMKLMFQCDPSQLPAEEVLLFSRTSNDLFAIFAPKPPIEHESKVCSSGPKHNTYLPIKLEEKKNFPISYKIDKTSQENVNVVEKKHNNTVVKNKHIAQKSSNFNSNSTTYFGQSEHTFSEQQTEKLPTSIYNQMMNKGLQQSTYNQSETTSNLMNSNLERSIIDEPRDKPCEEKTSFPGRSLDDENDYNVTINSELLQASWESKCNIKTEIPGSKKISLTNYFAKNRESTQFQKSRTIHQFNNWSSESDDESDLYHKLSEAEEEMEKSTGFTTISCAGNIKNL